MTEHLKKPSHFTRLYTVCSKPNSEQKEIQRDILSWGRELFAHSEPYLAALVSAYATVVGEVPKAKREGPLRRMLGWNMKPKAQCELWNETMRLMQATD